MRRVTLKMMRSDRELVQIVDVALAEANRKAGAWLVCRPGCTECCMGPFPITRLDAERLRTGLAELANRDFERANRVRERARGWTGGEDEPCPALDRATGTCEVYSARPLTCRTFGPAIRWGGDAVGVCELNFQGASDDEIAACLVEVEDGGMEADLLAEMPSGETTVALALLSVP